MVCFFLQYLHLVIFLFLVALPCGIIFLAAVVVTGNSLIELHGLCQSRHASTFGILEWFVMVRRQFSMSVIALLDYWNGL